MKGVLFLGSGNSIASKLPTVEGISEEIFNGHYNYGESGFIEFTKENKCYKEDAMIKKMRNLMKVIQEVDNELSSKSAPFKVGNKIKFTGSIYKGQSNYEDLYFIANEIRKSCQGLSTNSTINSIILNVEQKSRSILKGELVYERVIDLGKTCLKCVDFIDWLIPHILVHKAVIGLGLVVEIARFFNSVDIITLNHDLVIEDILQQQNIEYDDGFHGEVNMGSQEFKGFNHKSNVKLVKPHGSINWIANFSNYRRLISIKGEEKLKLRGKRILSGTNKILAYNEGVFSEMFYQFHSALKSNQLMIMSGYEMGDEGINMRIGYWLQNPLNTLIILHKNPDELIENSYLLKGIKEKYEKEGRLKIISDWLSNVNYEILEKRIKNS